jgi:hypothetical protein
LKRRSSSSYQYTPRVMVPSSPKRWLIAAAKFAFCASMSKSWMFRLPPPATPLALSVFFGTRLRNWFVERSYA